MQTTVADSAINVLIARFENDMQFSAHSTATKINCSNAAQSMLSLGQEALPSIIRYLEANDTLSDEFGIRSAWIKLLRIFVGELRIKHEKVDVNDLDAWLKILKKGTSTHAAG
ncbi:hypothetical protein KKG46_03670 [Patescibacteria group bacterium]|nr:hypothetical protein [Patescibacteria group bacterium]